MPVSGEWEVLTSNGFLCHSPDICRAPSKREWGLFEKLMELNASHSKERAGLISTLRASSGLEIIIGADKVQRCQCQLLSGMHFKKQFKKPSDVGIILRDQIRSKWEKFIWHFGVLKELRLYKLYSVCVCVRERACVCVGTACTPKGCRCVFCKWGEGMRMRIMGKSFFLFFFAKEKNWFQIKSGCVLFFFFQRDCTKL